MVYQCEVAPRHFLRTTAKQLDKFKLRNEAGKVQKNHVSSFKNMKKTSQPPWPIFKIRQLLPGLSRNSKFSFPFSLNGCALDRQNASTFACFSQKLRMAHGSSFFAMASYAAACAENCALWDRHLYQILITLLS